MLLASNIEISIEILEPVKGPKEFLMLNPVLSKRGLIALIKLGLNIGSRKHMQRKDKSCYELSNLNCLLKNLYGFRHTAYVRI
jgi:hypothetical protein